jgi:hypothetical protein
MSDTSGLMHKSMPTFSTTLGVIASLIAIIGFVFGITRIYGDERPLIPVPPPTSSPTVSPSPTGSPDGVSRTAYTKKVDKICQATYDENLAANQQLGNTREYGVFFFNNYREMLREWSAITPPRGDQGTIDSIIDLLTRSNLAYNRTLVARTQQQYDKAELEATDLGRSGTSKARAYGFRVCGAFD